MKKQVMACTDKQIEKLMSNNIADVDVYPQEKHFGAIEFFAYFFDGLNKTKSWQYASALVLTLSQLYFVMLTCWKSKVWSHQFDKLIQFAYHSAIGAAKSNFDFVKSQSEAEFLINSMEDCKSKLNDVTARTLYGNLYTLITAWAQFMKLESDTDIHAMLISKLSFTYQYSKLDADTWEELYGKQKEFISNII